MSAILKQLNRQLASLAEAARPSLVEILDGRRGRGSGVIIHPDGLILTNAHVARGRRCWVRLDGSEKVPAKILGRDRRSDLAALSIEGRDLAALELGDPGNLRPGAWVMALGFPWGVDGAATAGMVIDIGEPIEIRGREMIQVGFHLRPGHSGGPLISDQGTLVGINTMIAGPDIGLAIPLQKIHSFLRQAIGGRSPAFSSIAIPQ